jgi:rare lipoprotein A (peptidoglycan hydrolase)
MRTVFLCVLLGLDWLVLEGPSPLGHVASKLDPERNDKPAYSPGHMKSVDTGEAVRLVESTDPRKMEGLASWYGEEHRGKTMANGESFDPQKFTAASWFFPLGTRVRVTAQSQPSRSVVVTITDRGPARRLVRQGRIVDLSRVAFEELASPDAGLIRVAIERMTSKEKSDE